jgi:hypothetical protein
MQPNFLSDSQTVTTLEASTNLSASVVFLEAPMFTSGGNNATSVAVADLNGDGKPDLVVANGCDSGGYCANGVVSVLLSNGNGTFQPAVSYASGGYAAYSVAVGDVNGDGKPDLLVANECDSSSNCTSGVIGVLLGNGDGTFQPAVGYASGGLNASSVAVADVNGDGKADVFVSNFYMGNGNYSKSTVGVLLGNGDGTFQPVVSYDSGGAYSVSVAVGDVNGDGKPDLVVANQCVSSTDCTNGAIGVLLGNGNGTFQAAVAYSSGGANGLSVASATSVALGDVNGDGKPDLVVSNQCGSYSNCQSVNGTVGVLLGNGDGTFQAAITYASGAFGSDSIAVADVNGDGKLDLLVANQCAGGNSSSSCTSGTVSVFLGKSDGTFLPPFTYDSGGYYADSIAVADANGDGKLDLLVVNECALSDCSAGGGVGVLLGNGDGTFQAAPNYSSGGQTATSTAVADVNGDGKPDLIIANQCASGGNCANGEVSVLLGNGNGTFQTAVSYASGGYGPVSVAVKDVNGDGKPDLVIANQCASSTNCANGTIGVLLGNGDGTFQGAVSYGSGGYYAAWVAVADVNGDGKPDLVVANQCPSSANCANGTIGVLLGNGDGTFQTALSYGSGGEFASSVAVADVNGDGKPDLVAVNEYTGNGNLSNGTVAVLLGNGNGTFQQPVTYSSAGAYAFGLAISDVNGDGKPDLLVTNQCATSSCTNGILSVLLGNGDGTFQAAIATSTPQIGIGALALADFDGDGKLDVASGAGDFLLLGNGDGTFQPPLILGGAGPGIAVGDFNLDGKPDLAVGGITILLNINPTTHTATTTTLTSSPNPSTYGQTVLFKAVVSGQGGGNPTGSVSFADGGSALSTVLLANGSASLNVLTLAPGSHSITASYGGDSNFSNSVSAALTQTVKPAATATAITLSPNPSTFGQSITITAAVTSTAGVPAGAVTFYDGATILGTGSLNSSGQAALSTPALTIGSHTITASYGGNSNFAGSTSAALTQTVNKANTTTAITTQTPNPSVGGQPVTVMFTVKAIAPGSGTPTGNVTVSDGAGDSCTAALAAAGCSLVVPAPGQKTLTASYVGDSNFYSSTSAGVTHSTIDFSLSATPTSRTIKAGQKTTYSVTLTSLNGFSGANSLSCAALPSGSTCSLVPKRSR